MDQGRRSLAIDALKGVAILSVLLLHAFPREWLVSSFAWFHIWQAVPVFMVLLGVTGYRSRVSPLGDYYVRRARRLLPALMVTWIVLLVAASRWGTVSWDLWVLAGRVPSVSAPGNYFITLMLEFALVLPLLRMAWRRSPVGMVLGSFFLSLAFEVAAYRFGIAGYAYSACLLRYLFAVALGFWVADGRSVLPILPIGLGYLAAYSAGLRVPFFIETWRPQDVFAFAWSASMVQVGLKALASPPRLLTILGRASYHIFLVQMVWFAYAVPVLARWGWSIYAIVGMSLVACGALGVGFHALDASLQQRIGAGKPRAEHSGHSQHSARDVA